MMKIRDSKGNKKDISSFFHSKSQELLFRKIYYFLVLCITICMLILSIILISLIPFILISLIIVLTLVVISILVIQEHLANVVFYIMKVKENRELNNRVNQNRKYKDLHSSKKSRFIFKNTPFNSKKRFSSVFKSPSKSSSKSSKNSSKNLLKGSKNSNYSDSDYIEIK